MNDLFHAYIIGGSKEETRAKVAELLSPTGLLRPGNPDFISISCVNFSIDQAKELRAWQSLSPVGERKAYVVYMDFITREAQNALLKTLEEPTPNTHIFLCIPKTGALLDTLRSRARLLEAGFAGHTLDGKKFIGLSLPDRLAFVSKMLEKSESEEASAEVRERALSFLNDLEAHLAKDPLKNRDILKKILDLKKYLYIPGASVRTILESIALVL